MAISNLQTQIKRITTVLNQAKNISTAIINHTKYSRLPDNYVELEYIQSTGTQYLNTSYVHTANTKINCKINATQDSVHNYQFIFGSRRNSYHYNALTFATRWNRANNFCYCRTGNEKTGGTPYYNQDIEIEAYQKLCTWVTENSNSSSITTTGTVNAGVGPIGIFCVNTSSSSGGWSPESNTYAGQVKLYYFNISEIDELVREFIPAKRVSDNVIGLYELHTNIFITNVGSGTLIAGPEI